MNLLATRPPRIAFVFLGISVIIHMALHSYLQPDLRSYVAAVILGASGFALMMWAWSLFKSNKTAVCPTALSAVMVMAGPYRLSRNPMYLGMTAMLIATAFAVGTLPMFLAPVAFFSVMNWVFIPYEERKLAAQFGLSFAAYSRHVRRWF